MGPRFSDGLSLMPLGVSSVSVKIAEGPVLTLLLSRRRRRGASSGGRGREAGPDGPRALIKLLTLGGLPPALRALNPTPKLVRSRLLRAAAPRAAESAEKARRQRREMHACRQAGALRPVARSALHRCHQPHQGPVRGWAAPGAFFPQGLWGTHGRESRGPRLMTPPLWRQGAGPLRVWAAPPPEAGGPVKKPRPSTGH